MSGPVLYYAIISPVRWQAELLAVTAEAGDRIWGHNGERARSDVVSKRNILARHDTYATAAAALSATRRVMAAEKANAMQAWRAYRNAVRAGERAIAAAAEARAIRRAG